MPEYVVVVSFLQFGVSPRVYYARTIDEAKRHKAHWDNNQWVMDCKIYKAMKEE